MKKPRQPACVGNCSNSKVSNLRVFPICNKSPKILVRTKDTQPKMEYVNKRRNFDTLPIKLTVATASKYANDPLMMRQ